jgi:hypothetical protein
MGLPFGGLSNAAGRCDCCAPPCKWYLQMMVTLCDYFEVHGTTITHVQPPATITVRFQGPGGFDETKTVPRGPKWPPPGLSSTYTTWVADPTPGDWTVTVSGDTFDDLTVTVTVEECGSESLYYVQTSGSVSIGGTIGDPANITYTVYYEGTRVVASGTFARTPDEQSKFELDHMCSMIRNFCDPVLVPGMLTDATIQAKYSTSVVVSSPGIESTPHTCKSTGLSTFWTICALDDYADPMSTGVALGGCCKPVVGTLEYSDSFGATTLPGQWIDPSHLPPRGECPNYPCRQGFLGWFYGGYSMHIDCGALPSLCRLDPYSWETTLDVGPGFLPVAVGVGTPSTGFSSMVVLYVPVILFQGEHITQHDINSLPICHNCSGSGPLGDGGKLGYPWNIGTVWLGPHPDTPDSNLTVALDDRGSYVLIGWRAVGASDPFEFDCATRPGVDIAGTIYKFTAGGMGVAIDHTHPITAFTLTG